MRDNFKRNILFDYLNRRKLNTALIQETHSEEEDECLWRKRWAGDIHFSHGTRHSKGVAIFISALVSLSKTLNHNYFVFRMGRKAVGPVCCVMHVKEPRTIIVKVKGLAPVFLDWRLEHPAGWICARYKFSGSVSVSYVLTGFYEELYTSDNINDDQI